MGVGGDKNMLYSKMCFYLYCSVEKHQIMIIGKRYFNRKEFKAHYLHLKVLEALKVNPTAMSIL